eukprot:8486208-Pyramimonas_sp.AAC.1
MANKSAAQHGALLGLRSQTHAQLTGVDVSGGELDRSIVDIDLVTDSSSMSASRVVRWIGRPIVDRS